MKGEQFEVSDRGSERGRMRDFTVGSIPDHLIAFSVPLLLGSIVQSLYAVVDSVWVGRFLGSEALAAVSISFPVLFGLTALVLGLSMAASTMVAQFMGARDETSVSRTVSNALVVLILCGIILAGVGIIARYPILRLLHAPSEVIELSAQYLGVFLTGLSFLFVYTTAGSVLRGLGDSRTPLRLLIWATLLNVVLDPVLILGLGPFPRLGVSGAALASVVAQGLAAVMSIYYLVRARLIGWNPLQWKFDLGLTRTMLRIGLPSGGQQLLIAMGMLAVSRIVNGFGPVAVAAYGIGMRIEQFAYLPGSAMSMAATAMVGQNLGAGDQSRVRSIVGWALLIAGGLSAVVALVIGFIPQPLIKIFTTDAALVDAGSLMLRILALSYVPFSVLSVFGGVLRGAGDTVTTMLITLVTLWVVRIPLASYLSSLPGLAERGIWMALVLGSLVSMLVYWMYYCTGRWQRKVVVKKSDSVRQASAPAE